MAPLLDPLIIKLGPWGWARRGVDTIHGWVRKRGRLFFRYVAADARWGDELGDPHNTNPLHYLLESFASKPACGSPTGDRTIEFGYLSKSPRACKRCLELAGPMLVQFHANTR